MRRAIDDSAQTNGARKLGIERVRNIVLPELTRTPARGIQVIVVKRQIDVRQERWHRFETLQERGELFGIRRLGWNIDDFLDGPLAIRPVPEPDGGRQVLEADDDANEAVCLA